jgi:hypothetical protein
MIKGDWAAEDQYDPERSLWRVGRRSFLFLGASAIAAALLPKSLLAMSGEATSVTPEWVGEEVARYFLESLSLVKKANRMYDLRIYGLS